MNKKIIMVVLLCYSPYSSATVKIDYVKNKYEHTFFDQTVLFYPAKNPKRLLISFGPCLKNFYSAWSMFWQNDEQWSDTAYLFLQDNMLAWYLGNNKKPMIDTYSQIINHFIKVSNLDCDQVFTLGSSMGGYGAIFYAITLGLKGAIVLNPQVDKKSASVLNPQVDKKSASRQYHIWNAQDQWQDLDQVVANHRKTPFISLSFGHFVQDQAASFTLINALKEKNSLLIIRTLDSKVHYEPSVRLSRHTIEQDIYFMENQDRMWKNVPEDTFLEA